MLYWSIGRDVLAEQRAGDWGDGVVARIADDLREATGGARGFSWRNLFYMRRFAAMWPDAERVQDGRGAARNACMARHHRPHPGREEAIRRARQHGIEVAVKRAKLLDCKHEGDGSPPRSNPSSDIWRLIDCVRT